MIIPRLNINQNEELRIGGETMIKRYGVNNIVYLNVEIWLNNQEMCF